jgi:hypothetical protein
MNYWGCQCMWLNNSTSSTHRSQLRKQRVGYERKARSGVAIVCSLFLVWRGMREKCARSGMTIVCSLFLAWRGWCFHLHSLHPHLVIPFCTSFWGVAATSSTLRNSPLLKWMLEGLSLKMTTNLLYETERSRPHIHLFKAQDYIKLNVVKFHLTLLSPARYVKLPTVQPESPRCRA